MKTLIRREAIQLEVSSATTIQDMKLMVQVKEGMNLDIFKNYILME